MQALFVALTVLSATPEVALLSSQGEGPVTELRFQPVGAKALTSPVTSFWAVPGSTVRGTLLPGTRTVVAVAQVEPARDSSFAGTLLVLNPGTPARHLVDRVAFPQRPLVLDGRVFVQRGRPGSERNGQRVDALTIDEVDLRTGTTRTVYATQGFTAFPAGVLGHELLVYRVSPEGGELLAVHADVLSVRTLARLPALAFDFTVDAKRGALLYTLGTPGAERWAVERLDVKTGAREELATGASVALLPTLLPGGRVAFAPGAGQGLADVASKEPVLASHGAGFERVRAEAGGVLVGLHEAPGAFAVPFAVGVKDGRALELRAPADQRLDVAGVLP